jgi:hypothetical protein
MIGEKKINGPTVFGRPRVRYGHLSLDQKPTNRALRIYLITCKEVMVLIQECLELSILVAAMDILHNSGASIIIHQVDIPHGFPPGFRCNNILWEKIETQQTSE